MTPSVPGEVNGESTAALEGGLVWGWCRAYFPARHTQVPSALQGGGSQAPRAPRGSQRVFLWAFPSVGAELLEGCPVFSGSVSGGSAQANSRYLLVNTDPHPPNLHLDQRDGVTHTRRHTHRVLYHSVCGGSVSMPQLDFQPTLTSPGHWVQSVSCRGRGWRQRPVRRIQERQPQVPGTRAVLTGRQDVETGRSCPGRCTRGAPLVGTPPSLSRNYVLPPALGSPRLQSRPHPGGRGRLSPGRSSRTGYSWPGVTAGDCHVTSRELRCLDPAIPAGVLSFYLGPY